jgi:hypothetical protein
MRPEDLILPDFPRKQEDKIVWIREERGRKPEED